MPGVGWPLVVLLALCQIVGPERVECGDLAVFRLPADVSQFAWTAFPEEFETRFVDVVLATGERALVFAARRPGRITLVVALCQDGVPTLLTHQFENVLSEPEPKPGPVNGNKPDFVPPFVLLWVEESSQRTPEQAAAQNDKTIREALAKEGWKLLVVDKDAKDASGRVPENLAPWLEIANRKGLPRLFVISRSGAYRDYSAPRNVSEFRQILRELGLRLQEDLGQSRASVPRSLHSRCPSGVCVIVP